MTRLRFSNRAAWAETGLLVHVTYGFLCVSDLNPHRHIQRRITRWQAFRLGLHLLRRSISRAGW